MNSKGNKENTSRLQPIISISGWESNRVIQIANFLPKKEKDTLFNAVCANQEAFRFIGDSESINGGSLHLSSESEKSGNPKAVKVYEACDCLSKRIMKLLPSLFTKLDIKPFPVSHIPLSIINGLNGHKGMPHTDDSGGRFKISLLYYFNKAPKEFRGGALEFYEKDATFQNGHRDKAYAKIEHEDNLLIAFPSQMYHGVTEVQLESDDFEKGRFVVVGFLGLW